MYSEHAFSYYSVVVLVVAYSVMGAGKRTQKVSALDALNDSSLAINNPFTPFRVCETTKSDDEGPFYKVYAPIYKMEDLENVGRIEVCKTNVTYGRLLLNGTIRQSSYENPCGKPVRAMVEVWQANSHGLYSDVSWSSGDYTCRARLITGSDGFYSFATQYPGRYRYNMTGPFRPAHVHFRITPLDDNYEATGNSLITALYFHPDIFLRPNDGCTFCRSNEPSLGIYASNKRDLTTLEGTWDVLLA
ncbi:chlorocatechol 1,2-dioxygenase-like [Paramacrobiotus metropolitanus]|uniref:chlorocatechol 1,2-dioxygenase-like n=1 Tax=Paramacrobiotus metropolitanus TaxID=2943436 RepID=UPI0024459449|nr:chlorocatechol 1,2-dioxygenase-like [Paramacrobiotus metropolitanus]